MRGFQSGLFGLPELPVLPPTAAKWRERLRGHLALRQEGSPPSCTTCFSVITGKPKSPVHSILNLAFYRKCGKLPMVSHRFRRSPEQARAVAKSFFAAFGGREGGERIGGTAPGPPVKGLAALCNPAFRQACIDTQKYVTREFVSNRMNVEHDHLYQVAISPDLNITAEEFAGAWNADPDTHNLATAHSVEEKASQFMDPTLLIGALLSIPAGVTTIE